MDEYEGASLSPSAAAERGYIDEVVNPRADSRALIPRCSLCGATRKPENRWRKHDKRPAVRWRRRALTAGEAKPGTGSGRPGRLSVCSGLLARRMQRLTGRALRLLVLKH